jgi:hypothetical protein
MRSELDPETQLDVELSAICGRNRYTADTDRVVDELRRAAGARTDVLARVAGTWAGYFDSAETRPLVTALLAIEGTAPWVEVGRHRRELPTHGAPRR